MKQAIIFFAFVAVIFAAGGGGIYYYTQSPKWEAEAAIKATLKDPYSAKFRNVHKSLHNVCGWVNSKNGFGAYSGARLFAYDTRTEKITYYEGDLLKIGLGICGFS